ncbi:MAG: flavin reductase family protein [Phycisphaerae bacterium]|nr:flavin reductase family protein [Phycisphaerae bacterium]
MEFDPERLTPAERYKLLIGCIVPRPIAVVSTLSPHGEANLAPFSFFAGVGSDPMALLFCPANRADGGEKDTLANAKPADEGGTGEFVVNVATEAIATRVAGAAEPLPYGRSEFELVGLTPVPARVVRPPRVLESPACFECRTLRVVRLNPGVPTGGNVVVGRVVHVHVRDDAINERLHIDADRLAAFGRMGGSWYCTTRERFEMPMGAGALALDPASILPPRA